jgi:hypothetical protein
LARFTGYFTTGKGYVANVGINEAGYFSQNAFNGTVPTTTGVAATFAGTSIGYGIGKYIPHALTPYMQWSTKPFTELPISMYGNLVPPKPLFGLTIPVARTFNSPIPSAIGTSVSPFAQEFSTPIIQQTPTIGNAYRDGH